VTEKGNAVNEAAQRVLNSRVSTLEWKLVEAREYEKNTAETLGRIQLDIAQMEDEIAALKDALEPVAV
jgi:chromosome segregation ATPase